MHIRDRWELSDEELAMMFKVELEDIEEWHQRQSLPQVKSVGDIVEDLMSLFEMVNEKFKGEEADDWIITAIDDFEGMSPLEAILENPHNIATLKMILSPN